MFSRTRKFWLPALFFAGAIIAFRYITPPPDTAPAVAPVSESHKLPPPGFPSDIIDALHLCLGFSNELEPDVVDKPLPEPVRILSLDEAIVEIEKSLGPPVTQGDLWTNWILRLPEGLDRRIHLEIVENAQGKMQQNLSVFQMDQSGKATRVQLPDEQRTNPKFTVITEMLNAGEVLRKETSKYFQYANGERLEIVEADGRPAELEVVKGEIFFRCDEMKSPESCTCIR